MVLRRFAVQHQDEQQQLTGISQLIQGGHTIPEDLARGILLLETMDMADGYFFSFSSLTPSAYLL